MSVPDPVLFPSFVADGETLQLGLLGSTDLESIWQIEQRAHANPWQRQHLASSLENHICVGVYPAGASGESPDWVGYGVLAFAADEAELLLLVLDSAWQGRGVGTVFLHQLLQFARQRARTLFLEVRASNLIAQAVYEKLGFNQAGIRPNYYPGVNNRREDALIYALELDLV